MYEKLIGRVMNLLLNGEVEVLKILAHQYERSEVKEIEESGKGIFVSFKVDDEIMPLSNNVKQNFAFGDVNGVIDGVEGAVGFILFIRNGYLDTLEGYANIPGSWDSLTEDIPLVYMDHQKRNLKELEKKWSN